MSVALPAFLPSAILFLLSAQNKGEGGPFPRSATDFESTWPHKQLWLRAFPLLFHPPSRSKSCPSNNYLEITFLLLINGVGQCAVLTLDLFIITASGFALRNSFIPHFTSNVNLHYNNKFPQCWGAEGKENIEVSFFLLNFNLAPEIISKTFFSFCTSCLFFGIRVLHDDKC